MKLRECAINAGRRAGVAVRDMTVDNPVLVRDVRTRMRGGKPFMLVGAYAALLTVAALIAYANAPFEDISRGSSSSPVGSILFATIVILQAVLLTIITPGLTAAAIASEKEKRTFELLALTPVTARQVAAGKLIPVLLFVLMLMLVSVPLAMLCVVLGGFSPGNVASVYLYVFGGISIIAAFGLLMSSVYANSSGAVISTYIAAFIGGGMSISALSSYMISATMGHGGWWLGRTLSVSFLSILCGAAIVVGLTDAAASRITNRRTPSAVLTRIPLLILAVIAVGSVLWNMSPPASPDVGDIAVPLLGIIMGFMTVCGWFFCTADKAPTNRNPLAIRKILRRELSGALPWVMLMTALLVLGTTAYALIRLQGVVVPTRPTLSGELISTALAALMVPIGIGAVMLLASMYARKRALAAMVGFLFSLILWLGFPIHLGVAYSMNKHMEQGLGCLTAYFWPLLPFWDRLNVEGDPTKLLGVPQSQLGVFTAIVYLAITALALLGYACAKPMRKTKADRSHANDRAA